MASGMTRLERDSDGEDAYLGGLDWDMRSVSGWQTTGQITGAHSATGDGYGVWAMGGQSGAPSWRYWVELESFSRDFEINDVGYQWRADMVRLRPYVMRYLSRPWRMLRDGYVTVWGQYAFNHDRPEIAFDRRVQLDRYGKLHNLWGVWAIVGHRLVTRDDRETRGGPVYPRPWEVYSWIGGESDTSRRLVLDATFFFSREREALTLQVDGNVRLAAWDRLNLALYWRWRRVRGLPRWIETREQPQGDHYLFGDMHHDELELRLGGVLGLHRRFTVQLFGQLLHSVGTHDDFRELYVLDDGGTTLGPTTLVADGDFSNLTLILNAILRLDLGGGAAAYLVYKMEGALERDGPVVAGLDLAGSIVDLWDRHQTHLLLLKLSYGWNL